MVITKGLAHRDTYRTGERFKASFTYRSRGLFPSLQKIRIHPVRILVDIIFDHYHQLLGRCELSSPEYKILKSGVVIEDKERSLDMPVVRILCERNQALLLAGLARRVYPEAAADIENSIALMREP